MAIPVASWFAAAGADLFSLSRNGSATDRSSVFPRSSRPVLERPPTRLQILCKYHALYIWNPALGSDENCSPNCSAEDLNTSCDSLPMREAALSVKICASCDPLDTET